MLPPMWSAESLDCYIGRPVIASKSRACREGHTSGPCRWLFLAAVGEAWKNARQSAQGSHKGHYVRLFLLGQFPIEHEIKIFYRVLQREQPAVVQIGRRVLDPS